jgi:hypothetical protein
MKARRSKSARRAALALVSTTVIGLLALVSLAGCPGHLDDPDRFRGDGGVTGECPDVPTAVFQAHCSAAGCHGPTAPAAGLDLASPGVAERVVGHAASECAGYVLADPENAEASLLVEKLGPEPPCGSRMPLGATLDDATIACVKAWIAEQTPVAPGPSDADAGDAGDDARDAADEDGGP